jgi:hypothetical protein
MLKRQEEAKEKIETCLRECLKGLSEICEMYQV